MPSNTPLKLNEQVYQEASEWFVEFRSGDLDDAGRRRFDLWARKSPEHLAAYLEIAAIWSEGSALDSDLKWDPQALVAQCAVDATNVVPFTDRSGTAIAVAQSNTASDLAPEKFDVQQSRPAKSSPHWFKIAASIAAVGLIVGTAIWYQTFRMPIYATTFGEQRSITLTDGSLIDINSHSKIRVRYSAREREVDLLEGQALFHVAKNPSRPFLVSSATTQVRAVGTEFDVYQKQGGTVVSVVEGRVAVRLRSEAAGRVAADFPRVTAAHQDESGARKPENGGNAPMILAAGEQVLVTSTAMKKAAHPNIASATSWTQRQLEFESASLSEVAEEFNRYNDRQLVIEDPTLYDFHITGVFSSSDPASLVRFLRERPGVRVTETASEIRVSKNIS
ncbi:MAG TPA: FecR domain-containing protein [Steroidobacteraceae bacterium]|jgi:transmembrane sensor|nr:FecR domain-containing protein [Steroidobacteraceae bacterium]